MLLPFYLAFFDTQEEKDKFQRIYEDYRQTMFYKANSILKDEFLAEDAVQEAFMRIMNKLHKVEEENKLRTKGFVLIITRNIALNMLKKANREIPEEMEILELQLGQEEGPEEKTEQAERIRKLSIILPGMKIEHREILELTAYYGFKVGDAAKLLGINGFTARKQLQRARKELHKRLEEEGWL